MGIKRNKLHILLTTSFNSACLVDERPHAADDGDTGVERDDGDWESELRVVRERHLEVVLALLGHNQVGHRAHEGEVSGTGCYPRKKDPRQLWVSDGLHELELDTLTVVVRRGETDQEHERHVVEDVAPDGDDGGERADAGNRLDVHHVLDQVKKLSRDHGFLEPLDHDEETGEEDEQLPVHTGEDAVRDLVVDDGVEEHRRETTGGGAPPNVEVCEESSERADDREEQHLPEDATLGSHGVRAEAEDRVALGRVCDTIIGSIVLIAEQRGGLAFAALGGAVHAGLDHLLLGRRSKRRVFAEVVTEPECERSRVDDEADGGSDEREGQEFGERDARERRDDGVLRVPDQCGARTDVGGHGNGHHLRPGVVSLLGADVADGLGESDAHGVVGEQGGQCAARDRDEPEQPGRRQVLVLDECGLHKHVEEGVVLEVLNQHHHPPKKGEGAVLDSVEGLLGTKGLHNHGHDTHDHCTGGSADWAEIPSLLDNQQPCDDEDRDLRGVLDVHGGRWTRGWEGKGEKIGVCV
eukprot:m.93393 g.93393  ORF g.93393 m.93393 type:complete len:525 (-) comp20293_c0_seq1:72-1646(-)